MFPPPHRPSSPSPAPRRVSTPEPDPGPQDLPRHTCCVYEGSFRAGMRHGRGTLTLAGGSRYEGSFRANCLHGHGHMAYANGNRYDGSFRAGRRDGHGTMTYADGRRYVGGFRAGRPHGHGTLTEAWSHPAIVAVRRLVRPARRDAAHSQARQARALRLLALVRPSDLMDPQPVIAPRAGGRAGLYLVARVVDFALLSGHSELARAIFAACRDNLDMNTLGRLHDIAFCVGDRPAFEVLTQAHAVDPFVRTLEAMAAGRPTRPGLW